MEMLIVTVLATDEAIRNDLVESLDGAEHLRVSEILSEVSDLQDSVVRAAPELIVAGLGSDCEETLSALAELEDCAADVLVCGPGDDSKLILKAMRLGVSDYLPLPLDLSKVDAAAERLLQERANRETPDRAFIVGVMGSKGGVGATVVSCQLAAALQSTGSQVVIADLNMVHGDVALYHDLAPAHGIGNLDHEGEEIDRTYLKSLIAPHASQVGVIAAPLYPSQSQSVQPIRLQRALGLLREFNEFVILDLPRDWSDLTSAALEMLDHLLLVTSLDVPSLAHCKLQLEMLEQSGVPEASIHIVVNRNHANASLGERDLEEFLGRGIDHRLPDEPKSIIEAVNAGKSLREVAPQSALWGAYGELAQVGRGWCGIESKDSSPARPDLLSRMRNLMPWNSDATA